MWGGIGTEKWILQNKGSVRRAIETMWTASHDSNGSRLSFEEFKRRYPIYDPGVNLEKIGGQYVNNNYVEMLSYDVYLKLMDLVEKHHRTDYELGEDRAVTSLEIGEDRVVVSGVGLISYLQPEVKAGEIEDDEENSVAFVYD